MSEIEAFSRQIRSRSIEHANAMSLLFPAHLVGSMVSILRQELDSMIRVIYLLSLPLDRRNFLISESVNGNKWRVTDKEMVDLAHELLGWTKSVYKFGCAFIHLSSFHDYAIRDPFAALPADEQRDVIQHCRDYHGGPTSENPTFHDFVPYLPHILEKISDNLECYLGQLENGQMMSPGDI